MSQFLKQHLAIFHPTLPFALYSKELSLTCSGNLLLRFLLCWFAGSRASLSPVIKTVNIETVIWEGNLPQLYTCIPRNSISFCNLFIVFIAGRRISTVSLLLLYQINFPLHIIFTYIALFPWALALMLWLTSESLCFRCPSTAKLIWDWASALYSTLPSPDLSHLE